MKTTVLDKVAILLFLVLLTLATLSFGEKPYSFSNENEKPCKLVSFDAKRIAPRTYINWEAVSTLDNYCFVLERSTDGLTYSIAQIKRGYASPNNMPLRYSFVDETETKSEHSYYRIKLYEVAASAGKDKILILSEDNLLDKDKLSSLILESEEVITNNNL